MKYLSLISLIFQLVAVIVAANNWDKFKNSKEAFYLYYLGINFLVEVIGAVLGRVFEINTYPLYNIYIALFFPFYFYWYRSIILDVGLKKLIVFFVFIFLSFAIFNFITLDWSHYHKYTFVAGAFLTMICTIFHFRQLLYSDEVLVLKHKLSFWISTGLLLFNLGMIPFMLLSDYFDFAANKYYQVTITVLNAILYGCFIIGFQWTKEKYNRF